MSRRVCGGLEFQEVGPQLLVRQPSCWEFYYSSDIFRVEGFLQIEELLIVMVYYMFSQHVTLLTLSLITLFLTICAESAVKPQSVN